MSRKKKVANIALTQPSFKKLNIFYKGKPVVQGSFTNGKYTREDVLKIANKLSNDAKADKMDCQFLVSLKYPEGWRSGYFYNAGENAKLYTHHDSDIEFWEDPKYFSNFVIYMVGNGGKKGGCDGNNDCLYNCLKQIIPDELLKIFPMPGHLKIFLGIDKSDKVHIDYIEKIEEKIGIKISVTGDHIYTSTKAGNQEIRLKLKNEHFTIDKVHTWQAYGKTLKERKPMIYQSKDSNNMYQVFDGENVYKISTEQFKNYDRYQSEYILIKEDEFKINKSSKNRLRCAYNEFVDMANELRRETGGTINMFKTGRITTTALNYFHEITKTIQPEIIRQDEAIWIRNASMGAMIYANEYEGIGYKYDIKSSYPSIMRSQQFVVPIKRGTFQKMTSTEFNDLKFYSPGIYRCIINGSAKMFRMNKLNYYTHYDLNVAKEMGFEINLIIDDQPNFLFYGKDVRISGSKIFKKYVDELFELKNKGVRGAKLILNCLWGVLTRSTDIHFKVNDTDDNFIILPDRTLLSLKPDNNDDSTMVSFVNNDHYFASNYARMKPFLLAKGRQNIYNIIKPHLEHVQRVHTDGFLISKKIDIETGDRIGDLKYEGYCEHAIVHNCMKVEGKFEI